jgi:hypothetical protein
VEADGREAEEADAPDAVTGLAHDQVPTVSLKAKNPKKISRGK